LDAKVIEQRHPRDPIPDEKEAGLSAGLG